MQVVSRGLCRQALLRLSGCPMQVCGLQVERRSTVRQTYDVGQGCSTKVCANRVCLRQVCSTLDLVAVHSHNTNYLVIFDNWDSIPELHISFFFASQSCNWEIHLVLQRVGHTSGNFHFAFVRYFFWESVS